MSSKLVSGKGSSDKYRVKVYLVVRANNIAKAGEPNLEIVAAKLTQQAAQSYVDKHVGCRIQKHIADKDFLT